MLKFIPLLLFVVLLSSCGTSVYVSKFTAVAQAHKNYDSSLISITPRINFNNNLEITINNNDTTSYAIMWSESSVIVNNNVISLTPALVPINAVSVGVSQDSKLIAGRSYNTNLLQGSIGVPATTNFLPPQTVTKFEPVGINTNVWYNEVKETGQISELKHDNGRQSRIKTFKTVDNFAQTLRVYATLQAINDPNKKIVFDKTYKQT